MSMKIVPMVLALALATTLGCAPEADREVGGGGGDQMANQPANQDPTRETGPEAAGNQMALEWGTNITGDERNYADAYTRATWVHANLVGEEWEQAGEDLAYIEDQITDLARSQDVPANVRSRISSLQPAVNTLASQILKKDKAAIQGARNLVTAFTNITSDQAVVAWMGEQGDRVGGGAGTAPHDKNQPNRMKDNR